MRSLSEDDFRDKVVRPLFLRLGFRDGRDLCGPNEHGKDAVFVEQDRLGLSAVVAVQTKKGNLNLASKASSNLVDAVTQMRTALETFVVFVADRNKVRPQKAVLCASGKINDAARMHILDEVKSPNIQFLDADDLIPRIDQHLPEIWLGIDADVVPYFRAIEEMVLGDAHDRSASQDGILGGAAADDAFVMLELYRTVKKTRKFRGKYVETSSFEEFPLSAVTAKKARRVLLVGEAGMGKSTGLLRIALECARKGLTLDEEYTIPILLKAVELSRERPTDIVAYCDEKARELTNSPKSSFTGDDLDKGKVLLMVDAVDEISSDTGRRAVLRQLLEFSARFPKCQVIVTSRPVRALGEGHEMYSFEEFRVAPIGWKQAEKIVKTVTANKTITSQQSQEFLRRLEKIHGIELNPLLVTVFAATTDYTKQDIPANITELFKKFTELMLGRWDERKGMKHQYQAPLKDFVLTRIGFAMHSSKKTSMLRKDAEAIARGELETRGHEADVEQMLSEIFDRSGLFRVLGGEIEFRHHLLQEFFAGRGIKEPAIVNSLVSEEWWKRALIFYFGENPERIEMLEAAMKSVNGSTPEKLFEAATTIGLALQACYLSPVAQKVAAWQWVVDALSVSQESVLDEIDPKGRYPLAHFFTLYMYARDSTALSHLKQNLDELVPWTAIDPGIAGDDAHERRAFWLMVGLIESGDIEEVEKLLPKVKVKSGKLLAAISLGCYLAHAVRPLSSNERAKAKAICDRLDAKVEPYKHQLMSEFGSVLLEYRNGELEVVDADYEQPPA
ncbi:MAG: NACHT domain-containing protein [Rhodocyclaceae bacterium]|nr:NACHT domain-containing protein [Rhodocyclaceae bacterium]